MDELQKRILKGQRIKERRLFCGLSQTELGNKLNVKFTTISKYESGEIKSIDSDILSLIADITNTDLDYFLLKTNDPEIKKQDLKKDIQYATYYDNKIKHMTQEQKDAIKKEVDNFADFVINKYFDKK